jgi:hypothetical protein
MNGAANTGGGGGGSAGFATGNGGSGVVIIRYNADPDIGQLRYNTDGQVLETSDTYGWKTTQPKVNFASSNMLTYSNDISNAVWTKDGVTFTTGQTAPDGSATAFLITENAAANADHRIYQLPINGSGFGYMSVMSIYVKYLSRRYFILRHGGSGGSMYNYFDLVNRTVSYSGTNTGTITPIGEITDAGNGWMRLKSTFWYKANTSSDYVFGLSNIASGNTNPTYTGDGTSGTYIWKPEVYSATDIEANGFRTHFYRNIGGGQYFTPNFTGNVEVLVVGGGGSGASTYDGNNNGNGPRGGGGAGGVIYNAQYAVTANTSIPVVVGAGGALVNGNNVAGNQGGFSQFGNIISLGGGAGSQYASGATGTNGAGGSGGGVAYSTYTNGCQPGAGNMGGGPNSSTNGATGGGGAGGPGYADMANNSGGNGGVGVAYDIAGRHMPYGGGGGAGGYPAGKQNFGLGGGIATGVYLQNTGFGMGGQSGGRGGQGYSQSSSIAGSSQGINYTGGGGGGGGSGAIGAAGGHGIVIVRYQMPTKCSMFLQSGTWICPPGVTRARVLVVAGGGGGGEDMGGGGGAGGLLFNDNLVVEAGKTYTVTVGTGGRGAQSRDRAIERGQNGSNSSFVGGGYSITATGGGGGASLHDQSGYPASSGGSGGGASGGAQSPSGGNAGAGGYGGGAAGSGTAGQGNNGSFGIYAWYPGGGGGAGAAGSTGPANGGNGLPFNHLGTMLYFAGGGAGAGYSSYGGTGGLGGGAGGAVSAGVAFDNTIQHGGGWSLHWGDRGNIGVNNWQSAVQGSNAGQNTGGGGGGGGHYNTSNAGGHGADGIVIIKWD